jgi:hypothetical protein
MPIQSRQQQKLAYDAADTPGGVGGMPQSVGKDFVAAGPAGGSFGKLPQKKKVKTGARTNKALSEGRVSKEAMDRAIARNR